MSNSKKMIVLKSSDDKIFEVEEVVALKSQTVAHMIEDDCVCNGVPLSNVTGTIFTKVIEYCKKHVVVDGGASSSEVELKTWDAEFLNIDQGTLFDLILAANYLNIKSLFDLTCQTVVNIMKGKTLDEIRSIFNIEKDFTPEEEAAVRAEYQWAFE